MFCLFFFFTFLKITCWKTVNRIYTIDKECTSSFKTRAHVYLELSELTLIDFNLYLYKEINCDFTGKSSSFLFPHAKRSKLCCDRLSFFKVIPHWSAIMFDARLCLKILASYLRKVCASCRSGVIRRKSSTSLIRHVLGERGNCTATCDLTASRCRICVTTSEPHAGFLGRWDSVPYPFFSVMPLKRTFSMWP